MDVARQICALTMSRKNTRSTADQRIYLDEFKGTGCPPVVRPGLVPLWAKNRSLGYRRGLAILTVNVFYRIGASGVMLRGPFSFGANKRGSRALQLYSFFPQKKSESHCYHEFRPGSTKLYVRRCTFGLSPLIYFG